MVSHDWGTILRITLVYILVAVIAAGIAYLADHLGRQIGKRKMSVLRLRPRHTSILITTCTGAAIALITLTVFAFLSEPVRGLLDGMEKLRSEEAELRLNIEILKRTLAEGDFIWRVDEPIVHMTVPGGLSYERTRSAVNSLLAEANSRTVLRSNEIAVKKEEPPVQVSDLLIDYDQEQVEEEINRLTNGTGMIGLRVAAAQNCLYGNKALVRLESWQVRRVFSENEVVAKREVKPDQAMLEFFRFVEDTRRKAIFKGMRPIDGYLGSELNINDFEKLQKKISAQKGKFELVAIANRDLYETSSLDIRIEVRRLKELLQEETGSDNSEAAKL